jgi:DNA-binding protein H-NS
MSNYDELIEQRKLLDQQILAIQQKEKQEAIELIKIMIEKHALSASDLFSKKVNQANKKVPAKYRNPATGETWTGRGKAPLWIVGKERETFIIRG